MYVAAALVIFAVAAAVAIVQATDSDAGQAASTQQQAAAQVEVETPSISPAPDPEPAAPSGQTPAQPQESSTETVAQLEERQSQASDAAGQQQPQPAPEESPGSQDESPVDPAEDNPLRGFIIPIAGACITEFEGHLPTAERTYRNDGVHEGLDFYQWASCTTVDYATEVLAAKAGVVVRADLDYIEVTPADWDRYIAANWEGEDILDELRGRQVWIDHGRGVVTRYAHLSAIAEGVAVGVEVQQGQVIGYPGESGQQEVYANPGTDIHLHFEIRIAEGWLGQGQSPQEARRLYLVAFGQAD